jgi:hypothetical protein
VGDLPAIQGPKIWNERDCCQQKDNTISDIYSYTTEILLDPGPEFLLLRCPYFLRKTTQWCSMQLSSTKFIRNGQKESDNMYAVVADGRSNSNSDKRGCEEASSYSSAKTQM